MTHVNFVLKRVQKNLSSHKILKKLIENILKYILYILLNFWVYKCLIYPTLRKILVFLKKLSIIEKLNKQVSKNVEVLTLGPKMLHLSHFGHD